MDAPLIFDAPGSTFAPAGSRQVVDGAPRRRFRKQIIKAGHYTKASEGKRFSIDKSWLARWAANFARQKQAGVRVAVPLGHTSDPEKNRGWVDEMWVEGDSLMATLTLVGEDALERAATSDVSLYSPRSWTDGAGNTYDWPILHVALCTDPVIPGLSDFEPLAASHAPIFLSLQPEDPSMSIDLKKIQEALGLKDDLTEQNAVEAVSAAFTAATEKADGLTKTVEKLQKQVTEQAQVIAASHKPTEPKPVDPQLLELSADNMGMKLDALVAAGKITPAVKAKLAAAFIGEDSKVLSLSLASGAGTTTFKAVCEALADNDPVKLGEKSGAQTLPHSLSHGRPDEKAKMTDEEKRQMERAAGIMS